MRCDRDRTCDITYISRYTGEHRAELQGSNAIHEILKERIAFLSGNMTIISCKNFVLHAIASCNNQRPH